MDYFGIKDNFLKQKKLFLFDMDGTIYNEDILFDGAKVLMQLIKQHGGNYVFITNNSSKGIEDYIEKLKRLEIEVEKNNFFTSTQATAIFLNEKYRNKKIYCQGTRSMIRELLSCEVHVVEEIDDDVAVVLVGFDTELTSEKLRKTCELLNRGLPFLATNCDLRCPVSFGYIPDCGSICEMIKNCTGRNPVYIGKPEPTMINLAMRKFGVSKDETVVVGDRLYTDIAAGINAGVTSICVLTGEATIADVRKSNIKPTLTYKSVKDIANVLL